MFKDKFWKVYFSLVFLLLFSGFMLFDMTADTVAANQPLTITRGGTGIDSLCEGCFYVGESIDRASSTKGIRMDMDTGAVNIGDVEIDSVSFGDFIVDGKIGANTTTPKTDLSVVGLMNLYPDGTGTTTCTATYAGALMYSTGTAKFYFCNGSSWALISA